MDCAKFLRQRIAIDNAEDGQLLFEAFYSYLLPQFEGIDPAVGSRLFAAMAKLVGSARKERLRRVLNGVLGLELQGKLPASSEDAEDEEEELEEEEEARDNGLADGPLP
jgi:hypothetical protein